MIINKTKNRRISSQELVCTHLLSQARGLMFRPKRNLVMIFPREKKISLHSCFVFYALDILVVNEKKKIIEIKQNFTPFGFWHSAQPGKYIIELAYPAEYQLGDILQFTFSA